MCASADSVNKTIISFSGNRQIPLNQGAKIPRAKAMLGGY